MNGPQGTAFDVVAGGLERLGIISTRRFESTVALSWPRIVTGIAMMSKQTADLAMVGIAVGTAGTAGLAFAIAYWEVAKFVGIGIASGTISLVSLQYGSGNRRRAALVINASVLVGVLVMLPITMLYLAVPGPLIALVGAESESIAHGTVYLTLVAPALLFETMNLIASRTYTGVGDAYTEMVARAGGAVMNIVLSALFIFGFGLGVAGAALGTTLATVFVTIVMAWGMLGRSYGVLGMQPSPVPIRLRSRLIDVELLRQLIEISVPEIGRRLAAGILVFPLLWVAALFGPVVVTAFEVARRVRSLIVSVNWGLSLASSTLVGQSLGAGDEDEADAYGSSIVRLGLLTFVTLAVVISVFSTPIARLFVTDPEAVAQTAIFVAVGAISSIGSGLDGTSTGALIGAGDTRWPFVASLVGGYGFALPAAILGVVTPLGVSALYLAFVLETFVPGGINYVRFRSGRWKAISRRYREAPGPELLDQ